MNLSSSGHGSRGAHRDEMSPAEAIVGFLSFSSAFDDYLPAIEKLTPRQWKHVQPWLDDSGLAFYFLQKLKEADATEVVPATWLCRMERNFAANQDRVENMARRFDEINRGFDEAGVCYEVVKGFSLVPEFCASSFLRYQADFDYLVAEESLSTARHVLIDVGYNPRDSRSGKEFIFVSPGGKPSRGDAQYSPQSPHAVELHTDIWDNDMHGLEPIPKLFSVDQSVMRRWNGSSFPAQTDADAFLLQTMHACRHVFTQWIRVSNLFEIGYFLNRRWRDQDLWRRVEDRIGENAIVRDFVAIGVGLANRLFASPLPTVVQDWMTRMRPQSRIWLDHYARDWALCELPAYESSLFPRSKLVLFLQQQYCNTPGAEPKTKGGPVSSRFSRIASSLRVKPSLLLDPEWRNNSRIVRRSIYYALAQARYILEIPRWRWRNRTSVGAGNG